MSVVVDTMIVVIVVIIHLTFRITVRNAMVNQKVDGTNVT